MSHCQEKYERAFTLVETIVVLMLGSLILMAVLGVYGRVRANGSAILGRLQQHRLQSEILQKIAEDIDRLAAPGFEATIRFQNKLNNGYYSAQLILESSYYGNDNKKDIYEKIEWRTAYDPAHDTLTLYRMHEGLNVEDKVLGVDPEQPPYIPVAQGVTFFELKARQGETVLGAWSSDALPKAVQVGLSFAWPQELSDGSVGVAEEDIFFRTVAVDRTRLIPYQFVKKNFELPDGEDPNEVLGDGGPNAPTDTLDTNAAKDNTETDEENNSTTR
ncbi:MAG: PulJ/GspJ family protein [Planctomycetota bacterium]|jgi:competence protein ComGC